MNELSNPISMVSLQVESNGEHDTRLVYTVFIGTDAMMVCRVYNILNHEKEADRILFEDPEPQTGFLILPDLKWDRKTVSTLVRIEPSRVRYSTDTHILVSDGDRLRQVD